MKVKHIILFLIIYLLVGFTSAGAAEYEGINIHGFISQGYIKTTDNNFVTGTKDGTFEFNEFGINFSKKLTENLHVGMQLFSRDLGDYGNNEVTLDWAYGDYRWKDWLGMRVGKIKTPHGLYNENRDVDMVRNWIFLPQSVYPEIERDAALALMGAGIYGNVHMGSFGGLSYQAMAGTQNIEANETLAQSLMGINTIDNTVTAEDIDVDKKYAFSLVYNTPLEGLRLGGTFQYAEMEIYSTVDAGPYEGQWYFSTEPYAGYYETALKSKNYVVSAEYTWNNLMLVAEYTWSNRRVKIDTYYTEPADGLITLDWFGVPWEIDLFNEYGGEGMPSYNKAKGWYVGGTYRFSDWFELGSYYSEYYPNKDNKDGTAGAYVNGDFLPIIDPAHRAFNKDICLTARFDINAFWTIKLEGHKTKGTALLPLSENVGEDGQHSFIKDWEMYAAKVTYSF